MRGKPSAAALFFLRRNLHWTSLCQPGLDAALDEGEKREALQELIRKLPRKISFKFVVGPDVKDRELIKDAFRVAGFEHTTQTTYSERPGDTDIKMRISAKHRYNLARAKGISKFWERNRAIQ
jgi:hypothetical protein